MPINSRRVRAVLVCAATVTLAVAGAALAAPAGAAALHAQRPLLTRSGARFHAPDPSVLHVPRGRDRGWYVYFGGGQHIRGARAGSVAGRYGNQPVLLGPQAWFGSARGSPDGSHELWAPSVFPVGDHYVMYFTAWDAALGRRCLGIAEADRAMDQFHLASGGGPFCAPAASDAGGRKASAIDPSSYRSPSGRRYLVFQAGVGNRVNVAIWAYPMQPDGVTMASARPRLVLRASAPGLGAAIENPKLVGHGRRLFLFVSRNYWRGCRYHTEVYSARGIGGFRRSMRPIDLLTTANTGLCGPGGASLTVDGSVIVFTGWRAQRGVSGPGQRFAYTGNLRWGRHWPR